MGYQASSAAGAQSLVERGIGLAVRIDRYAHAESTAR
jgi:hypothetical protein